MQKCLVTTKPPKAKFVMAMGGSAFTITILILLFHHAKFHFVQPHDILCVHVRRVCLLQQNWSIDIHPLEDGYGLRAVGHAAINLVPGERDAHAPDVIDQVVVELVGHGLGFKVKMIPCPVVEPVIITHADRYATVGEVEGLADMEAGTSIDGLAGAKGVHHFLLGYFPGGHVSIQAGEGEIQHVLNATLRVAHRRGGGWCPKGFLSSRGPPYCACTVLALAVLCFYWSCCKKEETPQQQQQHFGVNVMFHWSKTNDVDTLPQKYVFSTV